MRINYLMISLMALAVMTACKQTPEAENEVPVADTMAEVSEAPATEASSPELVPVIRDVKHVRPAASTPAVKRVEKQPAETLYVETDGAQGRVWGHVTLQGDRGTGTIHDWDENTLAVTVTRHGDELFAVDQNSRQYVFKLKK